MADMPAPAPSEMAPEPLTQSRIKLYPPPSEPVRPFASLEELKAEHADLQRRRRMFDKDEKMSEEIALFLYRGHATGALLASDDERYAAQGLLSYWSNILYRRGGEVADDSLEKYDPSQAPQLTDVKNPYETLIHPEAEGRSPGWDRLRDEALRALGENRLLAIVGSTGSGRFQLVRDVLIPALKAEAIPGSKDWKSGPIYMGRSTELNRLLRSFAPSSSAIALSQLADEVAGPPSLHSISIIAPTVVIIERFEDQLSAGDLTQARATAAALLTMRDEGYRIILICDASGLGIVSALGKFGTKFRQGQVLVTFTSAELRQMVIEPARRVGLRFDDGLVDRLLADVQGDPAALSLLQFTLQLLWDARSGNRITHEAYDRLGGGRMAVARAAETAYIALSPQEREAARHLLLRLIRPATGTGISCQRMTRELLITTGPQAAQERAVLEKLIAAGLIVPVESSAGGPVEYSAVHESLATAWPRYLVWLEEIRAQQQWRLRLHAAAEQWGTQGREAGALWSGPVLELAQEEASRLQASGDALNPLEQEFLEASRRRRKLVVMGRWAVVTIVVLAFATAILAEMLRRDSTHKTEMKLKAAEEQTIKERAASEALLNASWQLEQGARLAEEQDISGSFLWYAKAWEQFSQVTDELKNELSEGNRTRFLENYRVRLGASVKELPTLIGMAYPYVDPPMRNVDGDLQPARAIGSADGSVVLTVAPGVAGGRGHVSAQRWRLASDGQWVAAALPELNIRNMQHLTGTYLSDDGKTTIITTRDEGANAKASAGKAQVWTAEGSGDARLTATITLPGPFTQGAISPDGRLFVLVTKMRGVENNAPAPASANAAQGKGTAVSDSLTLWRKEGVEWKATPLTTPRGGLSFGAVVFDWGSKRVAAVVETRPYAFPRQQAICVEWQLDRPSEPKLYEDPLSQSKAAVAETTPSASAAASSGDETARVGEPLTVIAYSRDSAKPYLFVASGQSGSRSRTWLIDPSNTSQPVTALFGGHQKGVTNAVFSSKGNRLATAGDDGTVWIWRVTSTPRGRATLERPLGQLPGGATVGQPRAHEARIFQLRFSEDGRYVATGSRDRRARSWEVETGQPACPWLYHTGSLDQVVFAPDGKHLVTISRGVAYRWNLQTGSHQPIVLTPESKQVTLVAHDREGKTLLAAGQMDSSFTGWAEVWDVAGKSLRTMMVPGGLRHAAINSRGQFVALVSGDGELRLFQSGADSAPLLGPDRQWPVVFATFGTDGKATYLLAVTQESGSGESKLRLWRLGPNGELTHLADSPAHSALLARAAFSRDCQRVVASTGERSPGEAVVWEVATTKLAALQHDDERDAHAEAITSATFSPDGHHIVTTGRDDEAILWTMAGTIWNGRKLRGGAEDLVEKHTADILISAFDERSERILTAGADRQVIVWKRQKDGHYRPTVLLPLPAAPTQAAFSADQTQRYVLTLDQAGTVRLWDAEDGRTVVVRHYPGAVRQVCCRADSQDNLSVLVVGSDSRRWVPAVPQTYSATDAQPPPSQPSLLPERLTLSVWDLAPFDVRKAGQLKPFAEMTAARQLRLQGDQGQRGGYNLMVALAPEELFERWKNYLKLKIGQAPVDLPGGR
jgi:WD40 repeat protein